MNTSTKTCTIVGLVIAALLLSSVAMAQLDVPRASPKASVSQTVGLTDITINYCRPGVKGRVIWGGLVPYDQVWRTGANEATTISFSTDVTIEGQNLAAGTYAIFTIPGKDEWTIILNKGAKLWGAYEYKQADDVLRFKAKPQAAEYAEWMTLCFPKMTLDSADVTLMWEKLKVAFTVKVDVVNKVLAAARKAITDTPNDWKIPNRAAAFCLENKVNLDEAGTWLDKSIALTPAYGNLLNKARWFAATGKKADAIASAKKAIEVGKKDNPNQDVSAAEQFIKDQQAK